MYRSFCYIFNLMIVTDGMAWKLKMLGLTMSILLSDVSLSCCIPYNALFCSLGFSWHALLFWVFANLPQMVVLSISSKSLLKGWASSQLMCLTTVSTYSSAHSELSIISLFCPMCLGMSNSLLSLILVSIAFQAVSALLLFAHPSTYSLVMSPVFYYFIILSLFQLLSFTPFINSSFNHLSCSL